MNRTRSRVFFAAGRLLLCVLPALAALGVVWLSRIDAAATERIYSRGVFPAVSAATGFLPSLLPGISVTGLLFALGAAILLGLTALLIFRLVRQKGRRGAVLFGALRAVLLAPSCILLLFAVCCAPNYNRLTFAEQSGLDVRPSSVSELTALCTELVQQANALRGVVSEDSSGVFSLGADGFVSAAGASRQAFNAVGDYSMLGAVSTTPKPFLFSEALSYLNLTGFYFPYTGEANVNASIPHFELPFTMCHELAHTRGFMREDEANFIAWLACSASDDPAIRYSGTVCALIHSTNALYAADPDAYFALRSQYCEGLNADLAAQGEYWRRYDTPAAEVSDAVNSAYLRANNQSDGTRSYGRMVDLLLADHRRRAGNTVMV